MEKFTFDIKIIFINTYSLFYLIATSSSIIKLTENLRLKADPVGSLPKLISL